MDSAMMLSKISEVKYEFQQMCRTQLAHLAYMTNSRRMYLLLPNTSRADGVLVDAHTSNDSNFLISPTVRDLVLVVAYIVSSPFIVWILQLTNQPSLHCKLL